MRIEKMLGSPQRLCLCDFSSQRQYGDHPPKAIWQPFPHTTHTIPHSHWEQRQDGGGALQLMFPRTPLQAQKMTMTKNLPESWVVRVGSCCWSTGAHFCAVAYATPSTILLCWRRAPQVTVPFPTIPLYFFQLILAGPGSGSLPSPGLL